MSDSYRILIEIFQENELKALQTDSLRFHSIQTFEQKGEKIQKNIVFSAEDKLEFVFKILVTAETGRVFVRVEMQTCYDGYCNDSTLPYVFMPSYRSEWEKFALYFSKKEQEVLTLFSTHPSFRLEEIVNRKPAFLNYFLLQCESMQRFMELPDAEEEKERIKRTLSWLFQ